MRLNIARISDGFRVRFLDLSDVDAVLKLCGGNSLYYKHHPPLASEETVVEDMTMLPPGKQAADKYFIGFYDGDGLAAIMDLIDGYPAPEIAYIGLFMLDARLQGRGVGSRIIDDCLRFLRECGFAEVRLAVDIGNPQSNHFWKKNKFRPLYESGKCIVMERKLR